MILGAKKLSRCLGGIFEYVFRKSLKILWFYFNFIFDVESVGDRTVKTFGIKERDFPKSESVQSPTKVNEMKAYFKKYRDVHTCFRKNIDFLDFQILLTNRRYQSSVLSIFARAFASFTEKIRGLKIVETDVANQLSL